MKINTPALLALMLSLRRSVLWAYVGVLSLLFASCAPVLSELNVHLVADMPITLQSAQALQRLFADHLPQYRTVIYVHQGYKQLLAALYQAPNSFALIDSARAFYIARDPALHPHDTATIADLRSLFALYQQFFHILVDARTRIDEARPRPGSPIAAYEPDVVRQIAVSQISTALFAGDVNALRFVSDLDGGVIDELQRNAFGAIVFLDSYPSRSLIAASAPYTRTRILPLAADVTAATAAMFPYLARDILPFDQYPYLINSKDIPALYISVMLVTGRHTDEQLVSELCRSFGAAFAEYRTLYPQFESLSLNNVQQGLGLPLHAGAVDCL